MSDERRPQRPGEPRKIRLPDGSFGVYMGETGGVRRNVRNSPPRGRAPQGAGVRKDAAERRAPRAPSEDPARRGVISRYSLTERERREAEERKRSIREGRIAKNTERYRMHRESAPVEKKFYHRALDKLHMWHLGLAVDMDSIIKGVVIGFLILFFALLQVTVFSAVRPFGAVPDLILPLVIAIGITEGERWGGVSGLVGAFIIEALGSAGIALLPLLYVPCGFIAGVLGTYYLRDSVVIRAIMTFVSGIPRALFTLIYVLITYSSPAFSVAFKNIIFPEFIATFFFALIPHVTGWLAMKPFHKTRAERVD